MTASIVVHPNTLAALRKANRAQIGSAMQQLLPMTTVNWLPANSPYARDASKRVDNDKNVAVPLRERFVRQVAASTLVHAGDAWSYLGRALDALLAGDLAGCAHLTYYAELRGAMALLAGEGIFIGNKKHVVVTRTGTTLIPSTNGTHDAAWKCLSGWSRDSRATSLLGAVIRPAGRPLADWTNSTTFGAGLPWTAQLFRLVGLDISAYFRDRDLRNHASYRPTRLRPQSASTAQIADLADQVWRLLEPDGKGGFPSLDKAVLPQLLQTAHVPARSGNFSSWGTWIDSLVPSGLESSAYVAALKVGPPTSLEDPLLRHLLERGTGALNGVSELRPILARTLMMLRVATGSALELLSDAGGTPASVSHWLTQLAVDHGLWASGASPLPPADLWADIFDALNDLQLAAPLSLSHLRIEFARSGAILGQAERVTVWSFA